MKELLTILTAWAAFALGIRLLQQLEAADAMFAIDDEYEALVEEEA